MVLYLDKRSIRAMQRDLGARPVARLAEWLDAYKVRTLDGKTITLGHRTRRIWRKWPRRRYPVSDDGNK